ncbi:MFS transporter [Albidovulum sp.]|uniref:MFS transporter n=1 Tax=Albidovulum sp. TaxID=1872424 RepID=UPI00303EF0B0
MAASATLAPLRNRTFRELWLASQVSNLGSLIQAVGAAWAMGSLTASHSMVALVQSSNTLPIMVFSLVSGALADNFDRRRIMLTAQVFMFAVSVALAVVAWGGGLTPWLLLSFTFLIGCGGALFNPSWQASIGDIVPRDEVPGAVGLNSMGFNLARSVGPAIGGAIVAAAGVAAAFAVNAASYVAFIFGIARLPPVERDLSLPREGVAPAIGAGFRYMVMSPALIRVMARAALFGAGASSVMALLPVYTRDTMGGTAFTYGVFLGCFGLGAIGGVLMNARLRAALRNERVVEIGFAGFALAAAVLALLPVAWAVVPALFLAGACWVMALSLFNTTVQLSTPRWVLGRALAFYQMATFGGMAAGAWGWGWLSDEASTAAALLAASALLVAGGLAGWVLRVSEFGELDLSPLGLITAAQPRIDLRARSGPIFVMVDYEVAQVDVPEFLALMQERRRIRIRDGARRWSLLRDLDRPELWSEKYYVSTWVDYARHLARRTKADDTVSRAIRALHRGAEPPKVWRRIERQTVPRHDDAPPLVPSDLA